MQKKYNMLRSRFIPVLLLDEGELVKTKKFDEGIYVGDPINAIRIFNEKVVDELSLFDISATSNGYEIDFELLKDIAVNANMPLTYGGGIRTVETAAKIISLGFEKISISSVLFENENLIREVTSEIGTQSLVVCLDVKKINNEYLIFTHRGKKKAPLSLIDTLKIFERYPVGEIVINSIDRDGTFQGYDFELAKLIRGLSTVNLSILGGCKDVNDFIELENLIGICGCAAGSYFTFFGKNNAVLLNYNKPTT
jgi:cyclase